MIPTINETIISPQEAADPLHEEKQSPVPGLVHRYPDRVLLLALDFCAAYCRYCTRSRTVGLGHIQPSPERFELAFQYIREHAEIRDVLLSGGDPLLLSEERLDYILRNLRDIPHVEIIRIGTKLPAVLPQRITSKLTRVLKKYHPLFMSLHFTHPDECTAESAAACNLLADSGIPLGSQTVLLKGINNQASILKSLFLKLLKMRVRPYYLYQCDLIPGSQQFRTDVREGLQIIESLRGAISGYAIPHFVIDAPQGGGKIALTPQVIQGSENGDLLLKNWQGEICRYPEFS